jgi:hypothetical protein
MDYAKMMFAVEVQKLAMAMYKTAHDEQKSNSKLGIDLLRWKAQNPPESFTQKAIDAFKAIALVLDAQD